MHFCICSSVELTEAGVHFLLLHLHKYFNMFLFVRFISVSEWITPPSSTNHSSSNTNNNNNNTTRSQQIIESEPPIPILSTSPQEDALQALTLRLQNELRVAKQRHLACTEVLLPSDLLHRIAEEMFVMSEKEPCGIRGCSLFIEFEDEPDNTR